jgi:hypothetical protein
VIVEARLTCRSSQRRIACSTPPPSTAGLPSARLRARRAERRHPYSQPTSRSLAVCLSPARPSMVWQGMGLLDDAIREHLELRRRRGADPGAVAREEHEALSPVRNLTMSADGSDASIDLNGSDVSIVYEESDLHESQSDLESDLSEEWPPDEGDASQSHVGQFAHVGQETAELDMSSIFGEAGDHDMAASQDTVSPASVDHPVDSEGHIPPENNWLETSGEDDDYPSIPPDQEQLWLEESSTQDVGIDA